VVNRANWIVLALVLFLVACAVPAIHLGKMDHARAHDEFGLKALLFGWIFLVGGNPAWLANPLLLAGMVCLACRRDVSAIVLGVAANLCALTTWLLIDPTFGPLLVGYYLWQASCLVLSVGAFRAWRMPATAGKPVAVDEDL
jgi:hypothetical protein